ncbi:MAG: SpoIIE family protein phosphatase [Bdellovibrio sp.]|nr:SpoIIE family protein phosphatase [Bdellovibrio sp.]
MMAINSKMAGKFIFPIKLKIVLILIAFMLSGQAISLYLSDRIFRDDKKDFLYESVLGRANSLMAQFKNIIEHYELLSDQIALLQEEKRNDLIEKMVETDRGIIFVSILERQSTTKDGPEADGRQLGLQKMFFSKNLIEFGIQSPEKINSIPPRILYPISQIQDKSKTLYATDHILEVPSLIFVKRIKMGPQFIAVAISLDLISNEFANDYLYTNILWEEGGHILIGGQKANHFGFIPSLFESGETSGADLVHTTDGEKLIIGHSKLKKYRLMVLSYTPETRAFTAMRELYRKAVLFGVCLLSVAVLISFIFGQRFKNALDKLANAVEAMKQGKDPGEIESSSNDETALFAMELNQLRLNIAEHTNSKVQTAVVKARSDKEKDLARAILDYAAPFESATYGPIEIAGTLRPSIVYAGSFWYHTLHQDNLIFAIGKISEHSGHLSALATTSLKSILLTISSHNPQSALDCVNYVNRTFHQIYKGKVVATLFFGVYNLSQQQLSYVSAGSEFAPIHFNLATPQELAALNLSPGPLLGKDKDSAFQEKTTTFKEQDILLILSPALYELKNDQAKPMGQKGLLSMMVMAFKKFPQFLDAYIAFKNAITGQQAKVQQAMDYAFLLIKFKK